MEITFVPYSLLAYLIMQLPGPDELRLCRQHVKHYCEIMAAAPGHDE